MKILSRIQNPKTYINFKTFLFLLYVLLSIGLYIGLRYYAIPEDVKQQCVNSARKNTNGFISVPIHCYINPFSIYLLILNAPGIYFTELFNHIRYFSDNFANLPSNIEYILSVMTLGITFLVSAITYIATGHIIDTLIRYVRNKMFR